MKTEKDLEVYLSNRYCQPEWAFFPQVRSSTGSASRVADGIAMNMYASRKYEIHGFEVKVSRSDWLNELKNPQKADEIFSYCDKWWLVVSDKDIVQNGELPKGWGLMVVRGKGLVAKVRAEYIKAEIVSLGFIASLLRSASEGMIPRDSIDQQVAAAWDRGEKSQEYKIESAERTTSKYKNIIETFERESGVKIDEWSVSEDAERIGKLLRSILGGEKLKQNLDYDLRQIGRGAESILEEIKKIESINEI